jgi:hypothetical protein
VAYLNFLVATPEADVLKLSRDPTFLLEPSLVVAVSHLIAYWVQVQPLGKLLGLAIDGGLSVSPDLWHPLRPPVYHNAKEVQTLHQQLAEEWQRELAATALPEGDWYRIEIEKVIRLFQHASERGQFVVSVIERPLDQERGQNVRIPFKWPMVRG